MYYIFRLKRRRLHAEKGQASKKLVEDMDDQIENLTSNVNYLQVRFISLLFYLNVFRRFRCMRKDLPILFSLNFYNLQNTWYLSINLTI